VKKISDEEGLDLREALIFEEEKAKGNYEFCNGRNFL
jgi:hypothetical protein